MKNQITTVSDDRIARLAMLSKLIGLTDFEIRHTAIHEEYRLSILAAKRDRYSDEFYRLNTCLVSDSIAVAESREVA